MKKPTIDSLLEKVEKLKNNSGVDLSTVEDLSIAVMNLISLEEHFFFTGAKTRNDSYFDTATEIRNMRKELMKKLMDKNEGETWCISKHLLAVTMRLIEVGNKLQSGGKKSEAKEMFTRTYKIYSIFWALKLKLIDRVEKSSVLAGEDRRLEELIAKLADCCSE